MSSKTPGYLEKLMMKFYDKKSMFMNALLSGNMDSAKKLAFELYNKHPTYLLFFSCIKRAENKQIILNILKKQKPDPKLVHMLLKDETYTFKDLTGLVEDFTSDSFIDSCIRKAVFLKKYNSVECSNENAPNMTNQSVCGDVIESGTENNHIETIETNDTLKIQIEKLLDVLDDFELYQFAINRNIRLDERPTANYQWYCLLVDKTPEIATKIILKNTGFPEIAKVLKYCNIRETGCLIYDIAIKYITDGYSSDLLDQAVKILEVDSSFFTVKTTLALLIASRKEENLIAALYLSQKYSFEVIYEIDLVHLFLCRYFLLFDRLQRKFTELDIKNIQQHNLAYIWSDAMIVGGSRLGNRVSNFQKEIKTELEGCGVMIKKFIENELVSGALSTFELQRRLVTSVICEEVKQMKIKATESRMMFSNLLGDECRYLFDKITIFDTKEVSGQVHTIRSVPAVGYDKKIFNNGILDLNAEFITEIEKELQTKKGRK